jgi:hypothetical protein
MSKQISCLPRLALASWFCLAVAGIPALGAEHAFDGVYSGKRILTKGSPSGECPAQDDVSVIIHGDTLTFTNSALKKFPEAFYPNKNGSFGKTYTDENGTVVHYHGHIVGDI